MADTNTHEENQPENKKHFQEVRDRSAKLAATTLQNSLVTLLVSALTAAFLYTLWLPLTNWYKLWHISREKGTNFSILVPELEGDNDDSQRRHVIQSLQTQFAGHESTIHIVRYPAALKLRDGEVSAMEAAAETQGRKWLKDKNADLLIWGSVGEKDRMLRLRFLPLLEGPTATKPYFLSQSALELPEDFGADFGSVLATTAAARIQVVYAHQGQILTQLIEPTVRKLQPLIESPPVTFDKNTKATVWLAYADGERRIGEEAGDVGRLETAITYYRKILSLWERKSVPLDWAKTEFSLGFALARLGELEGGTTRLEESVVTFRNALEEFTKDKVPVEWAKTQTYLSYALFRLGQRESSTARLANAVETARQALLVQTRQNASFDWAMTQNMLGLAFSELGDLQNNRELLEEANGAFRNALLEITRENAALYWGAIRSNIGSTLVSLSLYGDRRERLEEAVAAFNDALLELTREKVPLDWARAEAALGLALTNLAAEEKDPNHAEEAVSACRNALLELRREKVPLLWVSAQYNLGLALSVLGEQRVKQDISKGCNILRQGRRAVVEAIEAAGKLLVPEQIKQSKTILGPIDVTMRRSFCGN